MSARQRFITSKHESSNRELAAIDAGSPQLWPVQRVWIQSSRLASMGCCCEMPAVEIHRNLLSATNRSCQHQQRATNGYHKQMSNAEFVISFINVLFLPFSVYDVFRILQETFSILAKEKSTIINSNLVCCKKYIL